MRSTNSKRRPLPCNDLHTHARHRVRAEVRDPALHDLRVRVPRLDRALMHLALKVLLALLVRERAAEHGPQAALRGQGDDLRGGDAERGGGVRGEVREEVEEPDVVRAEVDVRDGDVVRPRVEEGLVHAAAVDERHRVVLLGEGGEVGVEGLHDGECIWVIFQAELLPILLGPANERISLGMGQKDTRHTLPPQHPVQRSPLLSRVSFPVLQQTYIDNKKTIHKTAGVCLTRRPRRWCWWQLRGGRYRRPERRLVSATLQHRTGPT
jgi:hypothetical protein